FFEIDPEVVRVAQNPQYFTYISDSKANISIAIGDGRLALRELDQRFDLLVIDAFTSDAIPVHLLTVEALDQYSSLLADDGLIALHTSNRYLSLETIVRSIAVENSLVTRIRKAEGEQDMYPSEWVVATKNENNLSLLRNTAEWRSLRESTRPAWRDDYSNIFDA